MGHEPLADVVESAWLELQGALTVVSRWGSRGLNCCRRFLQMLRDAEQGEPVRTLARLEQLLQKAYEPVDPDTACSNIVLSTVHGAKGLEFDAVFIPFMDWDPEGGRKDPRPPYVLERAPNCGDYLVASRPDRLTGEKDPLYALLSKLHSKRRLGEARRLFYVAVTRARRQLVMSGLAKRKGSSFSTSGQNPLGWLSKHYGIDELCAINRIACPEQTPYGGAGESKRTARGTDGFFVQLEPDSGDWTAHPPDSKQPEFAPAEFEREKPAFTVISPSELRVFGPARFSEHGEPGCGLSSPAAATEGLSSQAGIGPAACTPNVRGVLVHRLLAYFGKNGSLPSAQSASATLSRIGIESSKSLELARNALSEVQSCLVDPWLQAFYAIPPDRRRIEWPAECAHGRDALYSGVIDLAAEIEGKWSLIDFKTSRPLDGEKAEDFLQREMEAHRPQILAYREIWSKLTAMDAARIDAFIFWTALRESRRILALTP